MLLRSRIVLPITGPPIEDGVVRIREDEVLAVGASGDVASRSSEATCDLGDVVLLPGLVNAHCHLDYTDMAGLISPQKSFANWIRAIVALKASWSYSEFAQSWIHGARMLLQSGTTTVADVEAVPELLPEAWQLGPLRVISFREMISLKWNPETQRQFEAQMASWAQLPHFQAGLSPHALYTTTAGLLRRAREIARENDWLLMTHIAESEEELHMFRDGSGPLSDWLGPQRDRMDIAKGTPVQVAAACGYLGDNLLAVHANYLECEDVRLLAESGVSVVHCPRSRAYFEHRRFPFEELSRAGVNICLGTDSLASVCKPRTGTVRLSMFDEMRTFAKFYPEVNPETVLCMATVNGARALRQPAGKIAPGAKADLIAVPFIGAGGDAAEVVVNFEGDVAASMINGQWALEPKQ